MKQLLYKEWRLALHPATAAFWALSAMVLIPAYPYGVIFFYSALGLFFVCLTGRENRDLHYTLNLPVRKGDLVRARMLFAVQAELIQLALVIPFMALRNALHIPSNPVGMDANITLLAVGFVLLGVYNLIFFTRYYRAPDKVGKAFVIGSVAQFAAIFVLEALTHIVPFFRERLDTPDPAYLGEKLAALAVGGILYAGMTWLACRRAVRSFEKLDF